MRIDPYLVRMIRFVALNIPSFFGMLLFLFLLNMQSLAQAKEDSFAIKLRHYTKADSVRVDLLVDACVGSTFRSDTTYLAWANEAIALSEKIGYRLGKIRGLNCLGNYYYQRSIHDKALQYYLDALRMAEADQNSDAIIISKSNVANVYNRTNRSKVAILLFKECDAMLVKRGDTLSQKRAAILTNLSTTFSTLQQHDSSIFYTERVLAICEKKNIPFGIALSLINLGSEHIKKKNFRLALTFLDRALDATNKYGMDLQKSSVIRYYGLAYLGLGDLPTGIRYLTEAASLAQKANNRETLADVYKQLHEAHAKLGNYAKAYQYSIDFFQLKDSIYGVEKDKNLRELSTRYETEKKESLIQSLTQEKQITQLQSERKTTLLYGTIIAVLLAAALGYVLFNRYHIQQQNKRLVDKIKHEQALNQSMLTSIKSQMNPHFIFNALNTIQNFIYANDKLQAAGYLGKFSELIRLVLDHSSKSAIALEEELRFLGLYLELEKMRLDNKVDVRLDMELVEDNMDEIMMPPMIVQPYVENAFKHGLLHKKEDRQIRIRVRAHEQDAVLIWEIEDNGVGREAAAGYQTQRQPNHQSFASSATQKRLELLNEGRSNAIAVRFEDKKDDQGRALGTKVIIEIPYTTTFA